MIDKSGRRRLALLMFLMTWTGLARGGDEVVVPELPACDAALSAPALYESGFETFEDRNDGLLFGDPLLDPPFLPPPGWFGALEVDVVGVHVKNGLNQARGLFGDRIALPGAELNWTGAPRAELGYRFGQGYGSVLVAYEGLSADGTQATIVTIPPTGVRSPGQLRSQVNVNVVDIDYQQHEWSLGSQWDMIWLAGVRIGTSYYDTARTNNVLAERISQHFVGAGPHAGLDLRRRLGESNLWLRGRTEGAGLVGHFTQNAETSFAGLYESSHLDGTQWTPILRVQAGVHWAPHERGQLGFGYIFEGWWHTGRENGSTAPIIANGLYFRGEWRY